MINEYFYIALCFAILVALSYKKAINILKQYLAAEVNKVVEQLNEAEKLRNHAMSTLLAIQNKLEKTLYEKEQKIKQAKLASEAILTAYKKEVNADMAVLQNKYKNYVVNLQEEFWRKNKAKILNMATEKIIEEVKAKNIIFSNTIH